MNNKYIKKLWDDNIGLSIEMLISFFHADDKPITDIKEMCNLLSRDICNIKYKIYDVKRREKLAEKLYDYMNDYIEKKGGFDKLILHTKEEVEAVEDETCRKLAEALKPLGVFLEKIEE